MGKLKIKEEKLIHILRHRSKEPRLDKRGSLLCPTIRMPMAYGEDKSGCMIVGLGRASMV